MSTDTKKDQAAGDTEVYSTSFDQQVSRFFETEPQVSVKVEVAGKSHPGMVRPNNEDHYMVSRRYRGRELLATSVPEGVVRTTEDHAYTLAVADGMGGRKFGEVASLLALLTGWELGGDEVKWALRMNNQEAAELREKAEVFFQLLNKKLHEEARENPRMAGMGTTLTLCYTTGHELFVMHAGDSRAYLYREGALRRLTRDHNMAQMLVDCGLAEPGSPEASRMKHVLTNVVGGPDEGVDVDVNRFHLADGDVLLLCTDGLNDMVTDKEIAAILSEKPVVGDACPALIELALEHGGKDNVTVVLARYRFEDKPDDAAAGDGK